MQKLQDEENAKHHAELMTPESETTPRMDVPQDPKAKSKASVK